MSTACSVAANSSWQATCHHFENRLHVALFVHVHVHTPVSLYASVEAASSPLYTFSYTAIKRLSKSHTLPTVPGSVCPLPLSVVALLGQYRVATTCPMMCPGILQQTIHYHQPISSQPSLIRLSRCRANLSAGQVFSPSLRVPRWQGCGCSPKMLIGSHISLHCMPVVTVLIGPN